VFQARWNGLDVAVKRFKGVPNSKEFQRELSIMSLMHHPNLLRCYGGFADSHKDVYYLVMDRMDTDLHRALQAHPEDPENNYYRIGFGEALKMALALSRGLEHLHNCGLIHRDLKSVNMLIDRDYNVKLCDFGLSRVVATKKGNNMTGNVGTVSWIAPEVFDNQPYDSKADIYSFGIIMWELYTKQTPFADVNAFEIPRVVTRGDRPPIPKEMPKDYVKLMKQCWHAKPSKRPPASKIVKEITKMNQIRLFSRSSNSGSSSPAPSIGKTSMGGSASNLLQRLAPALSRRTESDKAISISSAPALNGKRSNSTSAGSIAEASSEDSGSSLTSPSKEDSSDVEAPQRSESPPPPAKKDSPPDSASPSAKRKRSASTAPSVSKPLSSSGEIPAPGSPSAQPSPSKATLRAKALLGKAAGDLKSEKKVRRLSARPGADTDDDE
jgi:serine/threonine protein kinase